MAYRQNRMWETPRKVRVTITWDLVTNAAYKLRFDNIGPHFSKCQVIIDLIKQTIPSSQREYDGETKTWFVGEAFIKSIKDTCEAMPYFEVVFTEKPSSMPTARMHSKEDDYKEFVRMLSFAHVPWTDTLSYVDAKRAYLRASMYLHPDIRPEMANEMSTLNVVWTRLKDTYFKQEAQV